MLKNIKTKIIFFSGLFVAPVAFSANQALVLSGGDNPSGNHYSQYLQTKLLAEHLKSRMSPSDAQVYFGAGNNTQEAPMLADVYRTTKTSAFESRPQLLPGIIEGNQAALKSKVKKYFEDLNTQNRMNSADTFFLMVSDHGMPNRDSSGRSDSSYSNNCINLWSVRDVSQEGLSQLPFGDTCLSKDELSGLIASNVQAKRTVFAMSQCFSGGFHQMSVSSQNTYPTAKTNICGFTAVTPDTTASGCTPDVDGPSYQGYERFFTQRLSGKDVVNGQSLYPAADRVLNAHLDATLEDFTKDIPLRTSQYYLWQWAKAIVSNSFVPRNRIVRADAVRSVYFSAQNVPPAPGAAAELVKEFQFVRQMQENISQRHPDLRGAMFSANPNALDQAMSQEKIRSNAAQAEYMDISGRLAVLRDDTLAPAWATAVENSNSRLSVADLNLEKRYFLPLETSSRADSGSSWKQEFNWTLTIDLSLEMIRSSQSALVRADYSGRRESAILNWALGSGDRNLNLAAVEFRILQSKLSVAYEKIEESQKRAGLIRRVAIYKSVIGAWAAIDLMQDSQALSEVAALRECENSSF